MCVRVSIYVRIQHLCEYVYIEPCVVCAYGQPYYIYIYISSAQTGSAASLCVPVYIRVNTYMCTKKHARECVYMCILVYVFV